MSSMNAEIIATCPEWAIYCDDRRQAVECKTCRCVYTGEYESPQFSNFGRDLTYKTVGGVPKVCGACKREAAESARKALPIDQGMVAVVSLHAIANYDRGGWDYVVETYTDAEIWEVIAGSKDTAQAIGRMGKMAKLLKERESHVGW